METPKLTRRDLLKFSPLVLLVACDVAPEGKTESFLHSVQSFNDWVQSKVFSPSKLAPEFSDVDLIPESGFRLNGKDGEEPDIDLENWTLRVEGMVKSLGT